jgi:hypothetical protein
VALRKSWAFSRAPWASRSRITPTWPALAQRCRGVCRMPPMSTTFTSDAFCRRRSSTRSRSPRPDASMIGISIMAAGPKERVWPQFSLPKKSSLSVCFSVLHLPRFASEEASNA